MPRFIVPRSTRTMLFTVSPRSLVKSAISASTGGVLGSYGTRQGFAPVVVNVQSVPCFDFGWYRYVNFVGALHVSSTGSKSSPLARVVAVADNVVPGTITVTGVATTCAQIHGCSCAPEKTGPPREWFVMVSRAEVFPGGRLVVGAGIMTAWTSFGPSTRPVTRPSTRPSGRTAKAS